MERLTYANVVATLALVIAVAGGGWAIGALPDSQGRISACYVPRDVTRTVTVRGRRVRRVVKRKGAVRLLVTGTRCARGESKLVWNQQGPAGAPGTPGTPGTPGAPGEPATKLFAYVSEPNASASPGTLVYGSGVTGFVDESAAGDYKLTFNRSLRNCVAQVTVGFGLPSSADNTPAVRSGHGFGLVDLGSGGNENVANVRLFFVSSGNAVPVDDPFMLSVFC